jgi:DNA repair protein RadC
MQTSFTGFQLPKLKMFALRETPSYRVSADPSACTDVELLSAVIGGPKQIEIAEAILAHFQGDLHRLHQAAIAELVAIPGVGEATAVRLRSALVLSRRLSMSTSDTAEVSSPGSVYNLCLDMATFDVEHLRVIILNTRNKVIGAVDVYKGSVNTAQIRPAEIFRSAIQRNGTAIIIAHNHPGGDPTPSPDDVAVTRALVSAGKLMEINVLDHLVIGHGRYVSLKEKGLGFA